MNKQESTRLSVLVLLILMQAILATFSSMAQSMTEKVEFQINYKQESLSRSKKSNNTMEVVIYTGNIGDAAKYFVKLAKVTDLEAEDIYQKVIDISEFKNRERDFVKDGFIFTETEIIFLVKNISGGRYEVFVRIDNIKGEIFTDWQEIVLEGS
jgi:hypothetical protein